MGKILEMLSGKKTYLLGTAGTIVIGLWMFGMIDTETAEQVLGFLGFGAAVALRAGIAKIGQ